MTRRKWVKLRRDRPELFGPFRYGGAFEKFTKPDWNRIRKYSKRGVVAILTAYALRNS